jgi:hypothetical protein
VSWVGVFTKIRGDIRNFAGVNDTGDKLFTGVSNNSLPVSLTPVINLY